MNKKEENKFESNKVSCNCDDNRDMEKKIFKLLLSIFILFLIFFVYAATQKIIKENNTSNVFESEQVNVISIDKTSAVYVVPNVGLINFNSTTEADTVEEALSWNNEKISRATIFLTSQGIDGDNVQTVSFDVSPRYEWTQNEDSGENEERFVAGYVVSQTTKVRIKDISKVGLIIDGITDSGINDVSDLSLVIDNEDNAKSEAREKAINDAKLEAESIADKLGVRIDGILSYKESFSVFDSGTTNYEEDYRGTASESSTTVETGKNRIEVTVNISFKINKK